MSTTAKPTMTGSFRGPFNRDVCRMAVSIMSGAKTSGNPQAYIAVLLDLVREDYAPAFATAVCNAVMYFGEERGLLGA